MKLSDWSKAVKERDGCCQECGSKKSLHAHHIKPRALGGKNTLDNGVTLCRKHHRDRHTGSHAPRTMAAAGKSKSVVKGISAPPDWWDDTELAASESGITSLSNFIRIAVNRYLSKVL